MPQVPPREESRITTYGKLSQISPESAIAASSTPHRVVRFGVFEVDLTAGEVRKAGLRLKLGGQPFQVLQALLERPQEIVTREELRQRLWSENTFVDYELALKKAVNRLREVLGDSAESPHFIETVPRRGYRFVGNVTSPSVPLGSAEPHLGAPLDTTEKSPIQVHARISGQLVAAFCLVGLAALLLWLSADKLRARLFPRSRSMDIHSIAVLPFVNLSKDPEQDYFSDGMTGELITDLAKVGQLQVISHTSVVRYKGTKRPLPEIARELGVDAIVEGAVLRSNDRVRITAQLIDAHSDRHLWADTYERNFGDILVLQGRLAQDIAEEVLIKLAPQQQSRLANARKTTPAAYDAYLRGRYLWNQRNAEAITRAIQYFKQAVEEDPNFAAAYSGLADCYWVGWGAKLDMPLADEYARKAISLQPDLSEAHDSLGQVLFYEHQMSDSGNELRRALELNPNSAMAHHMYAGHLLSVGRLADALAESDRAWQIDPFSAPVNNMRTMILIDLRKYDEALNQAARVREIIPQSQWAYQQLARIYWLMGQVPQAIEEQKKTAGLAHAPRWLKDQDEIGKTFRKSGRRAAVLRSAQLMEQTHSADFDGIWAAFAYGSVQDGTAALRCLERTLRERDGNLELQLQTAPEFDFLRTDPRYLDLVRRVGLNQ